MKTNYLKHVLIFVFIAVMSRSYGLSSGDVSVRMLSGYFWLDNSCTNGGPQGKVVSFRVKNTKGSLLQGVTISLGNISFTPSGGVSYNGGTPSFSIRTATSVYLGNIAAGDSATAFFFVGYNCLSYANNTNLTTDYLTFPVTVKDMNPGTVTASFTTNIYVIRNANNNTITILATTANLVGTMLTISVAYNISNVKPGNIIDMELSTSSTFPAGYSIMGCKFTASSITADFPVGMKNTHYSNSITSNLPSGGTVTIEWYLKINAAITGITSSNLIPFVVSDAGSAQRWQANTTAFTGTATPTNTISITKRVNLPNVLVNDTVMYTIVVKNSSTLYDIAIDKLVDNLPRDYKFQYMETNTGVFPRLVTYTNCTYYPVFNDTNYMDFFGQMEISAGVFSWVIPKNDSIKLIYSAKVSSTIGMNDTNFITAYVGSSSVGTAFAKVNVLAFLPLKVLNFNVEKVATGLELSWTVAGDNELSHFNLYRQTAGGEGFIKVDEFSGTESMMQDYFYLDQGTQDLNQEHFVYKLEKVDLEGNSSEYLAYIDLSPGERKFNVVKLENDGIGLGNINPAFNSVVVSIHDVSGKVLFSGEVHRDGSFFIVPFDFNAQPASCIFLTVEKAAMRQTQKMVLQ